MTFEEIEQFFNPKNKIKEWTSLKNFEKIGEKLYRHKTYDNFTLTIKKSPASTSYTFKVDGKLGNLYKNPSEIIIFMDEIQFGYAKNGNLYNENAPSIFQYCTTNDEFRLTKVVYTNEKGEVHKIDGPAIQTLNSSYYFIKNHFILNRIYNEGIKMATGGPIGNHSDLIENLIAYSEIAKFYKNDTIADYFDNMIILKKLEGSNKSIKNC